MWAVKAVVFTEYGPPEVLRVVDMATPVPGPGQVLVRVKAAGLQPFDAKLRSGVLAGHVPVNFPQRLGAEIAGVVEADAGSFKAGDEILGWVPMTAHATHALAEAGAIAAKPPGMPWAEAGALTASGQTAVTAMRDLAVAPGETILIHAAAGGVGSFAVQLARAAGATVIGTASPPNHDYLRELGAIPVAYGDGLADRVRAVAGDGVDAVLDCVGTKETIEVSFEVIKDRDRLGSIASYAPGVKQISTRRSADQLAELIELYEKGQLRVEVAATFPLAEAAAAHRLIETKHARGKIVLMP